MDKNREVRRRGVIGSRHIAATRRSRTSGFKYFSVCNDDGDAMAENNLYSRLQDSSKQQSGRVSLSLQESDSCKETESSQNKRKWPGSQEPQNHRPIMPTVEDMNDTSEDAGTARSEDDDDMPPSTVPHRPLKLKLHSKPQKDLSPIDPAAVPRKLRTAVIKRHQESAPPPVVADNPKQHLPNDAPAKLASTNSILLASNATLKPGRKMKPNNFKPPTAKLPKRSPTKVSKTEVEVAETLYDLSRMFMHREMSSVPEAKAESLLQMKVTTENAVAVTDRQPGLRPSTAAAGSSSSTHTLEHLGASKNKQLRVSSNTKDEGQLVAASLASVAEPCLSASSFRAVMESADAEEAVCLKLDKGQSRMDPTAHPPTEASVSCVIDSTVGLPSTSLEKNPETNAEKRQRTEVGSPAPVEFTSTSVSAEKLTVGNLVDSINVDDKDGGVVENLGSDETSAKLETRNRLLQLTPLEGPHYNKVKIDLTVPPKVGGKADDIMHSSMADGRERAEVDLSIISATEVTLLEKERNKDKSKNMDIDKENKQPVKMVTHDQRKDWKLAEDNIIFRERNNKRDGLKDRGKQEAAKQTPKGAGKNVRADSRAQRVDENASAALVTATTSSSLKSTLFPISVGMAGWPPGYYSPVAAAAAVASSWPTPAPVTGASSVENATSPQLSLRFFQTQQSRKRCAMHIYITHFIDCQQQVKCNPLWAVAYGNPACMYGSRAYNLNNPMSSTDSVFGNGVDSGLVGTSVASAPGPGSQSCELVLGCMKEKGLEDSPLTTANVHWARDRPASPCVDAKPPSQWQTQAAQKKPTIPLENGPAFGFPFNQSPAGSVSGSGAETSNTAGSNILVTAAMFARGSSASTNSSFIGDAVADSRNGLSDGSVVNAAVVQAQLLHSVIQQSTFPFSISSGHFGSTYSGHLLSQQAPHFFGNPFYDPHMVSQQSANDSSACDSQKQQQKHSQGVCRFSSLQTLQQQHQQVWTSFQDSQSPAGAALQHPNCPNEKDIVSGIMPCAKVALPMVDRNICGQNFPSVHVPSMNSQPLVLAAVTPGLPGHSQDFTLMPAFGRKQANKEKQEPQAHLQSQHQITAQVQQQKQHVDTQYHVTSAALQTGLKEIGSNTSQSVSSVSMNRESVSPDLLGLPAITSIMAPAHGQIIQSIVDLARGHGHPQNSAHDQPISGHPHQSLMLTGQDQKKQQQRHAEKQREVSSRVEETGIHINEGSYGNSNQSNVSRLDLKASLDVQVSRTNGSPKITKNATAPSNLMMPSSQGGSSVSVSISIPSQQPNQNYKQQMVLTKDAARSNLSASAELTSITFSNATPAHAAIFGKFPPGQRLPFPGQNESGTNQGVTHVYAQELPHLKIAQKTLPATSGIPPHDMLAAMAKSQGQQLNEPHIMNAVPIARISQAASLSSNVTTSLLPPSPVSKSGSAALAKNCVCVKDSYSSQQKSSLAAISGKGSTTTANVASISGPSPSKALQAQIHQNQYNTHQNQQQQQQHQRPAVLQQYPSNQKQVHQLLQQPLPQQQHLQIGQHLLFQQLPQYEVQLQSQLHSQAMPPPQRIPYQQNMSQKLEQPCRQMTSKSQQLGSTQQQDIKHLQAVLPTSFGDPSHTSGITNATTSGVMTRAKAVGETSMTCADSERSINAGTAPLHSANGSTARKQQANNSNTASSPCSNPLSQPTSNSGTVGKICEATGQ